MDDRELLELAAKAAGINLARDARGTYVVIDGVSGSGDIWNPLTDDGDALRLAVKLLIDVIYSDQKDNDAWVMAGPGIDCVEDVDGEVSRSSATRRAIVRAAAEIGKEMK